MALGTRLFTLFEGVLIAFDAIRSNKVRAGLTILGVAVGVFVVVILAAAIHGINQSVAKDFEQAGPNSFYLSKTPMGPTHCDGSNNTCPWRHYPDLTLAEASALDRLPSVRGVTVRTGSGGGIKYRARQLSAISIDAYTPNWLEVNGGDIAPGRNFTYAENSSGSRVVVINTKLATELFGESEPVGKTVELNAAPYRVIGIYNTTASFFEGGDQPKAIVPIETARRNLGVDESWMMFTVRPREGVERDRAIDDVTATLRGLRGLKPAADNNFYIVTQDQLFETWNQLTSKMKIVMLVLGSIGLMIGGVGVVAIMMISVTERTREIGVRKALGATRMTILWQFLVEASTLTTIGAGAGLILGWLATLAIRKFFDASIPPGAVIAALVASAITGVLFGMLPAMRASRLDPVDALRYE
ncbi:MAG: ABC transporter permease [Gemmatimonadaceae bacterium]